MADPKSQTGGRRPSQIPTPASDYIEGEFVYLTEAVGEEDQGTLACVLSPNGHPRPDHEHPIRVAIQHPKYIFKACVRPDQIRKAR